MSKKQKIIILAIYLLLIIACIVSGVTIGLSLLRAVLLFQGVGVTILLLVSLIKGEVMKKTWFWGCFIAFMVLTGFGIYKAFLTYLF